MKYFRRKASTTLRDLRKRYRITQTELGQLIGIKQRTVANYEAGIRKPSPEIAEKIATVFNLSTNEMWSLLYHPKE